MTEEAFNGQVSLTQMLGALDKKVAGGLEKRLKKLTKKKAISVPPDDVKASQIERISAYEKVTKDLNKWDTIVERNRQAKHINFPLDQVKESLPSTAEVLSDFKPRNKFEDEIQSVLKSSDTALHDKKELSKAEEKYLKAISADEASKRHKELQRMRVLLSSYASKMRRQKAIKSKSYRRLLKQERIRNHMKKVESNKDLLMDEIERLQKIRAKERASLKHKNTGKWAKHAKFRAKYDENARKAMIEQIGLAGKLLERPAVIDSDDSVSLSDDDDDDEEEDNGDENDASDVISSEAGSSDERGNGNENGRKNEIEIDNGDRRQVKTKMAQADAFKTTTSNRLIVSEELIDERANKRTNFGRVNGSQKNEAGTHKSDLDNQSLNELEDDDDDDDEDQDEQRKLMSEAFADDDVVAEFKKAKERLADEEQPKDIDSFLPGWGSWTGPGTRKVSKYKRSKFIIKPDKIQRRDSNLGNVIISEKANEGLKELQMKQLPKALKSEKKLQRLLMEPTSATFTNQVRHRNLTKPKISTKLGTRIEPLSKRVLQGGSKADWA